ncbi:hypothetical protein HPP92_028588 [Vanilla planifolia]|uniref:Protein kinase domain-containing protein n=1 Tax=Vanilla planifolia TaxID=51239 RepID=A0A835U2Z8_VANPL|nr:hypothetical protein HPP92_028588 [Vanilla planifolia]
MRNSNARSSFVSKRELVNGYKKEHLNGLEKVRLGGSKMESSLNQRKSSSSDFSARTFTFRDLAAATKNFRPECFLGEGGFGKVYKGRLDTGEDVAVKLLDRNGLQGNKEFLVEVLMLSLLHHPNLVNMIGYCADGDQRLLVIMVKLKVLEFPLILLFGSTDWNTRMKIAANLPRDWIIFTNDASQPVIYRISKSANILLDGKFQPKLSDFGLQFGPTDDKSYVSTRVMGTYGKPLFHDRWRLSKLADPRLQDGTQHAGFTSARRGIDVHPRAPSCTGPSLDVVTALYLSSHPYNPSTLHLVSGLEKMLMVEGRK